MVPVAEKGNISGVVSWRHGGKLEEGGHEFLLGRVTVSFIVQTSTHLKRKGGTIGTIGTTI